MVEHYPFTNVINSYLHLVEKIGYIEIRVSGMKGILNLSPETFDIKEIISILENVEDLLYPQKKGTTNN